jgi:hypothetical protein
MGKDNVRYINFPITLLKGFLENRFKCLSDILAFGLWKYHLDYEVEYKAAIEYFNVKLGCEWKTKAQGNELYEKYLKERPPMAGIELSVYWDFNNRDNHKSEFDQICLLAFLGLKSILGPSAFKKTITNTLLCRMSGETRLESSSQIPEPIRKYEYRYHLDKIKTELKLNWGLKLYGYHTRGFYFSFQLEFEDLVFHAEKKRKSNVVRELKQAEKECRERAIERVRNERRRP